MEHFNKIFIYGLIIDIQKEYFIIQTTNIKLNIYYDNINYIKINVQYLIMAKYIINNNIIQIYCLEVL
ncbi:hypothetical protein AB837_00282 [bacterium AB1]|nr:hypothetical protein AB837_00282 [bacterium AB1]